MAPKKKIDITDPAIQKAIAEFNLSNDDFPVINPNDPNAPVNRNLPISNIGGPPELAGSDFMGPVNDPSRYTSDPNQPPNIPMDVLALLNKNVSNPDNETIKNTLMGTGAMVGAGVAGKNMNLLGAGLNQLGNNVGTGIRGVGSAVANNLYPTAVLADMARKGFDPESELRQGMNAENIPSSAGVIGNELGKSATGESITKQKGVTDFMRTIGSFLGGLPKGAAQGVGSAVGNVEQLSEPIVKGVGSIPESFMKGYAGTQPAPPIQTLTAPSDATLNIGGKDLNQHDLEQIANYMKASGIKSEAPKPSGPNFMDRLHQVTNQALAESQYASPANLTSYLLTGKGINNAGLPNAQGGDAYLSQLETQARNIINKPIGSRTANEIKFLESYPENRKSYLSSQQSEGVGGTKLDPKSPEAKELNDYMDTKAQVQDVKSRIKQAIESNDINAISLLGNQIAAIGSVANKQGVVNGEEVNRVLGSIQQAKQQMQTGQWNTGDAAVKLGRELWSGLNTFANIVDSGLTAKILRYKNTYEIPEGYFIKSGLNLASSPMNAEDIITPERQDKAIARATIFDNVKKAIVLGNQVPKQLLGALDGLLGTSFGSELKPDPKAINKAIESYYKNEEDIYKQRADEQQTLSKMKDLVAVGDLDGIRKLLGNAPTQTKAPAKASGNAGGNKASSMPASAKAAGVTPAQWAAATASKDPKDIQWVKGWK